MTWSTLKRTSVSPPVILVGVTLLCLLPFVGKAFHIDDTLFIAAAKHIQLNPFNFYGFTINWYGVVEPMANITKNPPLTCYYIALAAKLFGWSEVALHIAFLVPAVAVALGSFYLAKQFCSLPLLAVLAGVITPVFLVSSTNIMCDTMMLAFWVWAVVAWMWGLDKNQWLGLLIGAVLITACALTKYFGMSLILLMFIYSAAKKQKIGTWVLYLLLPVAILAFYQWLTFTLYGRGLLTDAASYASKLRSDLNPGAELFWRGLVGLAFTGGCITTIFFYAPLLWSRRTLISCLALTLLFIFFLSLMGRIGSFQLNPSNPASWEILAQFGLMSLAGFGIVWLAAADLYKCRDSKSLLLFLWTLGTFLFAGFVNWTVNGRTILPIAPVAGILLGRAIDRHHGISLLTKGWRLYWPLFLSAVIALSVCWADYTLAGTARQAAKTICETHKNRQSVDVWFQGHWGFQYYMEAHNAKILNFNNSKVRIGDIIVLPANNTHLKSLNKNRTYLVQVLMFNPCRWISTMTPSLGAGFYSSVKRPLPFAFGRVPVEEYSIFVAK